MTVKLGHPNLDIAQRGAAMLNCLPLELQQRVVRDLLFNGGRLSIFRIVGAGPVVGM